MQGKPILSKLAIILLIVCGLLLFPKSTSKQQVEANSTESITQVSATDSSAHYPYASILLDVPLESQFAGEKLDNGCEVTALSMLLRYYGYNTNKNELANRLHYVPFQVDAQHYGNPHEGFVGDIASGNQAMGVFVEPIAQLARSYVHSDVQIHSEKLSFAQIIQLLQYDTPIWSLATVDLVEPTEKDFIDWSTTSGTIKVTPLIHAVVLTGMDQEYIYVNDPYGVKNRPVKIGTMQKIFKKLGQQSLYLSIQ